MKKFGLELELFLISGIAPHPPISIPKNLASDADSSMLCLEVRGKPYDNITEAVYSLKAMESKLEKVIFDKGFRSSKVPILKFSKEELVLARRVADNKGPIRFRNLYGYIDHKHKAYESTAGLHLSVTDSHTLYTDDKGEKHKYNAVWDFSRFFQYLDERFEKEIKDAKRLPGFYEIKDDGRIEYRSLPNDIDLNKLIYVVDNYIF